jgi:hypothetical protein
VKKHVLVDSTAICANVNVNVTLNTVTPLQDAENVYPSSFCLLFWLHFMALNCFGVFFQLFTVLTLFQICFFFSAWAAGKRHNKSKFQSGASKLIPYEFYIIWMMRYSRWNTLTWRLNNLGEFVNTEFKWLWRYHMFTDLFFFKTCTNILHNLCDAYCAFIWSG